MTSRRIPCIDCAAEKTRLQAAGFVVDGCKPDGANGMCVITFHDPADAGAPRAARMTAEVAAQPASPARDFGVPVAATAVVKRIEGFLAQP